MEKFDVAKYKEMMQDQLDKEGVDIKEKWGGKQLLVPEHGAAY